MHWCFPMNESSKFIFNLASWKLMKMLAAHGCSSLSSGPPPPRAALWPQWSEAWWVGAKVSTLRLRGGSVQYSPWARKRAYMKMNGGKRDGALVSAMNGTARTGNNSTSMPPPLAPAHSLLTLIFSIHSIPKAARAKTALQVLSIHNFCF